MPSEDATRAVAIAIVTLVLAASGARAHVNLAVGDCGGVSSGAGSCAGCTTPADILLLEIDLESLTDTPDTYLRLTAPLLDNGVTYNGGASCRYVPAINRTRGAIKALYR
jgi:hypothetical protein